MQMKTRARAKSGEAISESKAITPKPKASEKKKKVAATPPPGMLSGTRSQGVFSFLNPGSKKKAKIDENVVQAKKQESLNKPKTTQTSIIESNDEVVPDCFTPARIDCNYFSFERALRCQLLFL